MSGDTLVVTTGVGVLMASKGQEAGEDDKHSAMYKQLPTAKNYLVQNVDDAEAESP